MKNIFLFFSVLPTLLFAQGFTISGKVSGIPEGATVRVNNVNDNGVVATSTVKGNSFTLSGVIPEPGLYWITMGKEQAQHIFLENANLTITGNAKDLKNMQVSGSQSHKDFDEFRTIFNPLMGELNASAALINKAQNEQKREELNPRLLYHRFFYTSPGNCWMIR